MPVFHLESLLFLTLQFLLFHASLLTGHLNEFPPNYKVKEEHSVKHVYEASNEILDDLEPVLDVFDKERIAQERPHIQEHLDVPIDTADMSEKELQFHYFKIADADRNNKLDGQELVYFIIHRQHESHDHNTTSTTAKGDEGERDQDDSDRDDDSGGERKMRIFTDKELIDAIDPIMERTDHNKDGMIDWQEFVQSIEDLEESKKSASS